MRFAFVVPRFGEGIAGGAETLVGAIAEKLAARGDTIDILTTCAKDNRTWDNFFSPGIVKERGLTIHRFLVSPRNLEVWIPLQIRVAEGMMLSLDEQLSWMSESVTSTELFDFISQKGAEYDAMFFAPYLFGTTFWGSLIHPENSFLIPCLHDEHYAYTEVIQSMFRQVKGCLFNALPEMELARALYGRIAGGEVGMGFEDVTEEEKRSLSPFLKETSPYLLYVGRKETGKNVQLLLDYFVRIKDEKGGNLKLVIVGGGSFSDLGRDRYLKRNDIIDIGHVSEEEKRRLIRHSVCLCQPSRNESFSIVIMESWLLDVPVLVHGLSAVTSYHATQSGGGLYFASYEDFSGGVEALLDPKLASKLGRAGHEYVRTQYSWEAVLARFDGVMANFRGERELRIV